MGLKHNNALLANRYVENANLLSGLFHWWDFTSRTDITDKASGRPAGAAIDFTEVGTLVVDSGGAPHGGDWLDFTSSGSNYLNNAGIASNASASGFGFEHSQSDFTFATVFSLDSIGGSTNDELFNWRSAAGLNFASNIDNPTGELKVRIWDGSSTLLLLTSSVLSTSTNYRVIVTYDDGTGDGKLYINNVVDDEQTQVLAAADANSRPIRVGQKSWDTNGNFRGKIGPTGWWNRVFSGTERSWLDNSGNWRLYSELV